MSLALLVLLVGLVVIAAIIAGIVLLVRAASKPSAPRPYPVGPALNAPAGRYPDHDHAVLRRLSVDVINSAP